MPVPSRRSSAARPACSPAVISVVGTRHTVNARQHYDALLLPKSFDLMRKVSLVAFGVAVVGSVAGDVFDSSVISAIGFAAFCIAFVAFLTQVTISVKASRAGKRPSHGGGADREVRVKVGGLLGRWWLRRNK